MRKLVLLAALCLVAVLVLLWRAGDSPTSPSVARASTEEAATTVPLPERLAATNELDVSVPAPRQQVVEPARSESGSGPASTCIVFGRVVDGNDQPLAAVVVRLMAPKVWADGVDVPRLPGKADYRGWEIATREDGRFRFETPLPTSPNPWLTLEPDPFHDSARMFFGAQRAEARAPLHAGDNDLGTIRLVETGAIRGSVHDEAGAPIVDAKLVLGAERSQTLSRDAFSDAAGNFVVAHSPAGPMGLNAKAEGYLSEFRKPIDVELGRFTDHVDFVLRKAPTLSGLVVDDAGQPIEGVKLYSWPQSSGSGAGAKSAADGSFSISLPQEEPYTLEAQRDGFEAFGVGDRSTHYPPGTHDMRIVLERLAAVTMCVVDASTRKPIAKFGHEVLANMSMHAQRKSFTEVRNPPAVDHPDGCVAVSFRPGIDLVDVAAPGYESYRADPEAGSLPGGVLLVELRSTATVLGRVEIGGEPKAGVAIRIEGGYFRLDGAEKGIDLDAPKRFVPDRSRVSQTTSGPDGSFRFEGTTTGSYRLRARSASGEVATVSVFAVQPSSTVDLGTLELVAGAGVHGTVLVPVGRRASGLKVLLDDLNWGETQLTDADGRFRFDGLGAGEHELFLADVPGSIGSVPPVAITLAAGELRDVEIDAREHGTCEVDLTIVIGKEPAANAQVDLTRAGKLGRDIHLGRTGKDGHVTGSVPLAQGLGIRVTTPDDVSIEHPTARLDLTLDARIVETIHFETASLVVDLPDTLSLPAKCSLRLRFTSSAGGGVSHYRNLELANGTTDGRRSSATREGHRLQVDDVLAGDWSLELEIVDAADPTETVQLDARTRQTRPKKMYSATASVRLVAGQTATVTLH